MKKRHEIGNNGFGMSILRPTFILLMYNMLVSLKRGRWVLWVHCSDIGGIAALKKSEVNGRVNGIYCLVVVWLLYQMHPFCNICIHHYVGQTFWGYCPNTGDILTKFRLKIGEKRLKNQIDLERGLNPGPKKRKGRVCPCIFVLFVRAYLWCYSYSLS